MQTDERVTDAMIERAEAELAAVLDAFFYVMPEGGMRRVLTAALSDEQTQAGVEAAIPTANCCVCGRIIDTREKKDGGDDFGDETEPGKWTCSVQCFDAHVGFIPDVPAVEPEPVCTVALVGAAGFRWLSPHPVGALDHLPVGTPLYAAPVRYAIVPAQDEAEKLVGALKAAAQEFDRISCVPNVTETSGVYEQFQRAKFGYPATSARSRNCTRT